jgi:ABC-type nickel/cobalt efflux system permease component RcnA
MRRSVSIFIAAVMSMTGVAASFTPVQAATARMAPALLTETGQSGVQEVRHNRRHARRHYRQHRREARRDYRHHRRYSHHRHYGHRHYRSRPSVGFSFSLGVPAYGYSHGSSWKAACARKYRSFDWASGTYLGYDGYRHPCVL